MTLTYEWASRLTILGRKEPILVELGMITVLL
jgi:hypothetical protein